jgi:NADPH:quinone reductase-like Zn-dependent oxidoreductase
MRAIAIDDFGASPALHDLPVPSPGEGEVLVRVNASSVNGFDLAVASGAVKSVMEYHLPITLGKDFAGTVEAVGPDVTSLAVGERVFGVLMKPTLGDGTFAEYATANVAYAARVPDGLELETAGLLGLAGTAALDAVDAIAPGPGETVLVAGATGGVGSFVLQLAAARGAHVIATSRGEEEERHVRELGAHDTVDPSGDLAAALLALRPDGAHAAVHLAGDGLELTGLVVGGGRIASTLGLSQGHVGNKDVRVATVMAVPTAATLERLAQAVVAGQLRVPVQRSYPLAEVPRALIDFAAGTRGKLAVSVD